MLVVVFGFEIPLPAQVTFLPPGSTVAGLTLEEWSAEWWKWALGVKTSVNPLVDKNGLCAHQGQSGPVFFLGGSLATGGSTNLVTRFVTVSSDKHIFFPIFNNTAENVGRTIPLTAQELREEAILLTSPVLLIQAELDGIPVPEDHILRLLAPVFSYTLPDGENIFELFGLDVPGQVVDPAVSDGFWVMLAPVTPGQHELHFLGVIGDPFNSTHDVTYHLTVVPPSLAHETGVLLSLVQCVQIPDKDKKGLVKKLEQGQAAFARDKAKDGIKKLQDFQKQVLDEVFPVDPELAFEWTVRAQRIIETAEPAQKKTKKKSRKAGR